MIKAKTWLDIEAIDKFGTRCIKCDQPISDETTGIQKVAKGFMCDDCYFEMLGEEIEKHPIGSPRIRRRLK